MQSQSFIFMVLMTFVASAAIARPDKPLRPLVWASSGFESVQSGLSGFASTLCRRFLNDDETAVGNISCPGLVFDGGNTMSVVPSRVVFDPEGGLAVETGGSRFDAEFVSEISGNTWSVGLRNMNFSPGLLPEVGSIAFNQEIGWFQLQLLFDASAAIQVPDSRWGGVRNIAFERSEGVVEAGAFHLRSLMLGEFTGIGLRPVETFLADDQITLLAPAFILELIAMVTRDESGVVQDMTVTATTPCGEGPLQDCVVEIDAFEVRPGR